MTWLSLSATAILMPREREEQRTRTHVGRLKPLERGGEDHQHHHYHHHHHHLMDAGASLSVGNTEGEPASVETSLRFKLYFLPLIHYQTATTHKITNGTKPPT
jgi:hypothetical protein